MKNQTKQSDSVSKISDELEPSASSNDLVNDNFHLDSKSSNSQVLPSPSFIAEGGANLTIITSRMQRKIIHDRNQTYITDYLKLLSN